MRSSFTTSLVLSIILTTGCTEESHKAQLPSNNTFSKPSSNNEAIGAVPQTDNPSSSAQVEPADKSKEHKDPLISSQDPKEPLIQYRLTGETSSARHSLLAFRVNGFIASIKARPGTLAAKGTPLASLDPRDFLLGVEMAKANRDQAVIAEEQAKKEFLREQQLAKENVSTATVYEKIQALYQQAQLARKTAELNLEKANLALKDTQLLAPYDCVVTQQTKFEGENVQSGTVVFEVFDTAEPEMRLSAPERLMGTLVVGTVLKVTIPSASYSGKAEVTSVVPVISEKTRTFDVRAKLSTFDSKIVPGLFAEATLVNERAAHQ